MTGGIAFIVTIDDVVVGLMEFIFKSMAAGNDGLGNCDCAFGATPLSKSPLNTENDGVGNFVAPI